MSAVKHALRYMKGSSDLPIFYKKGHFRMHTYSDASLTMNPDNRRSASSFLFFLGRRSISFGAKTQTLTAQSAVEAEIMAISYEMKEAVYPCNFLRQLGLKSFNMVPVNCDNIRAISVNANRSYNPHTKRVALRFLSTSRSRAARSPFTAC